MNLIVTATNATCGGVRVPPGAYEFPSHGNLQVSAELLNMTNVVVGSGDTLSISPQQAFVVPGAFPAEQAFVLGFTLVLSTALVVGLGRKVARMLVTHGTAADL